MSGEVEFCFERVLGCLTAVRGSGWRDTVEVDIGRVCRQVGVLGVPGIAWETRTVCGGEQTLQP